MIRQRILSLATMLALASTLPATAPAQEPGDEMVLEEVIVTAVRRETSLMETPVASPGRANWNEVIAGREDVFLQGVEAFQDFMVVTERRDGLRHLRIIPWNGGAEIEVGFDEPTYVTWVDDNEEFDTSILRYGYSSLATPRTIYDLDLDTGQVSIQTDDGSISIGGSGRGCSGSVKVSPTVISSIPATATISPTQASSVAWRSVPTNWPSRRDRTRCR